MAMGVAYHAVTRDAPEGDLRELRAIGAMPPAGSSGGGFLRAAADRRVWAPFVVYGACFGIEPTINNIAALYFVDNFGLGLEAAVADRNADAGTLVGANT